jgi:hypothetical protein
LLPGNPEGSGAAALRQTTYRIAGEVGKQPGRNNPEGSGAAALRQTTYRIAGEVGKQPGRNDFVLDNPPEIP